MTIAFFTSWVIFMTNWNLADCLDTVASICADRTAIIQGERHVSWKDFSQNANSISAWFLSSGVTAGGKVSLYTYNHIAYIEASYACMKAGIVPININYRYKDQELLYLFENSDSEAVVIHIDFLKTLERLLPQLPNIKAILVVGAEKDKKLNRSSFVVTARYDDITAMAQPLLHHERSGDDLLFIYTGGMPKGVMWKHNDLYQTLAGGTLIPPPETQAEFEAFVRNPSKRLNALILPPLMHGTAFFSSLLVLLAGGTVLLTENTKKFDPAEVWTIVDKLKPNVMNIVGDTFARPLLQELKRKSYEIGSLDFIASSGALWSNQVKAELLEFHPDLKMYDGLGSSEAHNIGMSLTTSENVNNPVPRFTFGVNTLLVDEKMNTIAIEAGAKGMIAVGGAHPVGYYKDKLKSKVTFLEINGKKCSLPGDWAQVNKDGETFTLLGRGSLCINTGGEKVYPEEVETVIKRFNNIIDAVVVGVPDPRWGEAIAVVVSSSEGRIDGMALVNFVKSELASYKAPKHIIQVDEVYRAPSGKADYKQAKDIAVERIGKAGNV